MIEAYDASKHYAMLSEWWLAHGVTPPPPSRLPRHGFIVDGCVAGFMYLTETDAAIAEHMVGKPNAGRALVPAFKKLSEAIIELAQSLGFSAVITNTKVRYMAKHYGALGADITAAKLYRCTLKIGGHKHGQQ